MFSMKDMTAEDGRSSDPEVDSITWVAVSFGGSLYCTADIDVSGSTYGIDHCFLNAVFFQRFSNNLNTFLASKHSYIYISKRSVIYIYIHPTISITQPTHSPVLTTSAPISSRTASKLLLRKLGGIIWIPRTPSVFCAVSAVIAVIP